jgi:HK97 family phage major capsid protein
LQHPAFAGVSIDTHRSGQILQQKGNKEMKFNTAGEKRKFFRNMRENVSARQIGVASLNLGLLLGPIGLVLMIAGALFFNNHNHAGVFAAAASPLIALGNVRVLHEQDASLKSEGEGILNASKDRRMTPEERSRLDAINAERKSIGEDIGRVHAFREEVRSNLAAGEGARAAASNAAKKPFASIGEQLIAVAKAERGGRTDERLLEINAAASGGSEGVPADGGFLVQQDFSTALLDKAYEAGVVANKVTRIPIGENSNGLKLPSIDETSRVTGSRWGGVQVYWAAEADAATAKKPKFKRIELELKKLIGLCYGTDELLQDASAFSAVVNKAFPSEFSFVIDDAIIRGNGAGQPLGILNGGCLVAQAAEGSQTATTVNEKNVVKMFARMPARLIPGAEWYVNQDVLPQLPLMSIGNQPVYLPPGGLINAPAGGLLLGRPVNVIEQCETLGTQGDIIFANFGEFVMIDKGGIRSDASMHVRFLNDEQTFRWTYRCDGQPAWISALTPYKGSNTLSPFVVLAAR